MSRADLLRLRVPLIATAAAVPLYGVWAAFLATGGGDLAAQDVWASFVSRHPGSLYDLAWYGGSNLANYSLMSPYLMALFGVRPVAVLAGLATTWGAGAALVRTGMSRPLGPALLAAFAVWCDVASGRTTFALGAAFGIAACLAAGRTPRRIAGAAALAALATLASPVAGVFLVAVGAGWFLVRDRRRGVSVAVPPLAVMALVEVVLFPISGEQPMEFVRLWPPLLLALVVAACAPRRRRAVRAIALVYALGVVLAYVADSPLGTNVERLAELAAPALLLACALERPGGRPEGRQDGRRDERRAGRFAGLRRLRLPVLLTALVLSLVWVGVKTEQDLVANTAVPGWAARSGGVVAELRRLGASRSRVEAVPTHAHRESALLAPYVNLARGWNRQLDVVRGRLFYADGPLSPTAYRRWLDGHAVGYVVLPAGQPDDAAVAEAALVGGAHRPGWLQPVWRDAGWRVFRVRDAAPLAVGAAVVRSDEAGLVLRFARRGSAVVRIAYSRWMRVDGGACLSRDGDWTRVTVAHAGTYRIGSGYRLPWGRAC
ncbi:hypothetical protein BIV57_03510 [Mangrovactinospora gilvigrisea]|uniref:Uncharacterized protein n=1 Tax=Mangrovactinospora gilvigrisea TaxID=1428644 RepID=A0A1J7CBJ7_9ACTN|nr:hypothetical protein BIV57_03510 [Mangrovactinospora gilvigrisea]